MANSDIYLEYISADEPQGEMQLFKVNTQSFSFTMNYDCADNWFYLNYENDMGSHILYDAGEKIELQNGTMLHFYNTGDENGLHLEVKHPDSEIVENKSFLLKMNTDFGPIGTDETVLSDNWSLLEGNHDNWKVIDSTAFKVDVAPEEISEAEADSETNTVSSEKPKDESNDASDKKGEESASAIVSGTQKVDSDRGEAASSSVNVIAMVLLVTVLIFVFLGVLLVMQTRLRRQRNGKGRAQKINDEDCEYIKFDSQGANIVCARSFIPFEGDKKKGPTYIYMNQKYNYLNQTDLYTVYRNAYGAELLIRIPKRNLQSFLQEEEECILLGFTNNDELVWIKIMTKDNIYYANKYFGNNSPGIARLVEFFSVRGIIDIPPDAPGHRLAWSILKYLETLGNKNSQIKSLTQRFGEMTDDEKERFAEYEFEFIKTLMSCWSAIVNAKALGNYPDQLDKMGKKIFLKEKTSSANKWSAEKRNSGNANVYNSVDSYNSANRNNSYGRQMADSTAFGVDLSRPDERQQPLMSEPIPQPDRHEFQRNESYKQTEAAPEYTRPVAISLSLDELKNMVQADRAGYCNLDYITLTSMGADGVKLEKDTSSRDPAHDVEFYIGQAGLVPNPGVYISSTTLKNFSLCFEISPQNYSLPPVILNVQPARVTQIDGNKFRLIEKGLINFK